MEKEWRCTYLPDPFVKRDGSQLKHPDEWAEQVEYFKELAQKYVYGTWADRPKTLKANVIKKEIEYDGKAIHESIGLTINDVF